MINDARECEAIRLLRAIVEGGDPELPGAIAQAKQLLRRLRQPRTGRDLRAVTPAQLREIARLRGEGKTEHEISGLTGVKRWAVHYHIRPSASMEDALLENKTE